MKVNGPATAALTEAGNYWAVNYKLVQHFRGYHEAIILAYLSSKQDYWEGHGKLKKGKWFFCTAEKMREETLIEPRKQRVAIRNLEELGLIDTELLGMPQTRHFHVNKERIGALKHTE